MTALVRHVRIPCRYVSGYVCPRAEHSDRSQEGASHAWVEAMLPGLGWVGFDPTNNLIAGDRHIRKGKAASDLQVSVRVAPSDAPPPPESELTRPPQWEDTPELEAADVQQQQQQQQ